MDFENLSEEQILQRLLEADSLPQKTVRLERLGIPVTLRGLTGKQVYSIRERCTFQNERRGQGGGRLDDEQFNTALIAAATVTPNWGESRLLAKYSASGPEEVIKRILLAGEMSALGNMVLDLSGFFTSLVEVKN
ncbi:MAG: hypothetical protein HPY50_04945 [Firmicutes bacterium]|nr:hypothetical protein [Bacillota bacterium]